MRIHPNIVLIAFTVAVLHAFPASAKEPWREMDAVLVEACFDRMSGEPPNTIRIDQIADGMTVGLRLKLVGFTTTKRPVYQGDIGHPSRFTATLLQLPGTNHAVVAKRPLDLAGFIDSWREVKSDQCTTDGNAHFRLLNGQEPELLSECPDIGLKLSLKVASASEHTVTLLHLKERGVKEFNNLRGCREFIHRK